MRHHDEIKPLLNKSRRKFIPLENKIIRMSPVKQDITDLSKFLSVRRVSNDNHMANCARLALYVKLNTWPNVNPLNRSRSSALIKFREVKEVMIRDCSNTDSTACQNLGQAYWVNITTTIARFRFNGMTMQINLHICLTYAICSSAPQALFSGSLDAICMGGHVHNVTSQAHSNGFPIRLINEMSTVEIRLYNESKRSTRARP